MRFVDHALAARLEDAQAWRGVHYVRAAAALRPAIGALAQALGGGWALYAGARSPVSRVIGLGLAGPPDEAVLDEVEAFYRTRGAAPRVDLCPLADDRLRELLGRRGYRIEIFLNVLVCPLPAPGPHDPPPDVTVTRAGPDERELWLRTVAQGFSGREAPAAPVFEVLAPNASSASGTRFLAWVDRQPAGGGAFYAHAGVAELGGASTRAAFRRRGVQLALLRQRLAAAHADGCDLALVATEPGSVSQRNIERVGFRLAYTKMTLVQDPG